MAKKKSPEQTPVKAPASRSTKKPAGAKKKTPKKDNSEQVRPKG